MEIIKQIKDTEKRAEAIIAEARGKAESDAEAAKTRFSESLARCQTDRETAIAQAEAAAHNQAQAQIKELITHAQSQTQAMLSKSTTRFDSAVAQILAEMGS